MQAGRPLNPNCCKRLYNRGRLEIRPNERANLWKWTCDMRKSVPLLNGILLAFCLAVALTSCQASKATPAPATLAWQVQVSKADIKDSLHYVEVVTQYDGSKLDVTHSQNPTAGNVYLILNGSVSKTGSPSTVPFDWQWLVVRDAAGNTFHRLENDTFLEQFQYTPRITGLQLRLGEYNGWLCYEIPASAEKGKLTLAYTAEGSQQEIILQK